MSNKPEAFRNWKVTELEEAIKTLEEAMASGVAQASYQGGGSISYVTQGNMNEVIRRMYRALDIMSGDYTPKIKRVQFTTGSKGF